MNKERDPYALKEEGLSEAEIAETWSKFDEHLAGQKLNFFGFQANQRFHYQTNEELHYNDVLAKYLNVQINNLGDPYVDGSFRINSKEIEVAVLNYYAVLWKGEPYRISEEEPKNTPEYEKNIETCWGYICSMGSTEANLYGLWNARDYLSGKPLLNPTGEQEADAQEDDKSDQCLPPLLFYSQDTHYSIVKGAHMLDIKTFFELGNEKYPRQCPLESALCERCREKKEQREQCDTSDCGEWPTSGVPSVDDLEGTGSIDVTALKHLVEFFAGEGYPIIVNFNYGTAFKGAYDNIEAAAKVLIPLFRDKEFVNCRVRYKRKVKEGYKYVEREYVDTRNRFWFHVDGALGAAYMPFIEMAYSKGLFDESESGAFPGFDFGLKHVGLKYVNSISMSGHKWIGAPWPCGIYMTRRKYQLEPPSDPAYVGARDSTLAGSRNGLSALILWNYLARTSYNDEITKALRCQERARYAHRRLCNLEAQLKALGLLDQDEGMWLGRQPFSLSVYFKQVHRDIVSKYSLSREIFRVKQGSAEREKAYNHIFVMEHVDEKLIERLVKDLSEPEAFPQQ